MFDAAEVVRSRSVLVMIDHDNFYRQEIIRPEHVASLLTLIGRDPPPTSVDIVLYGGWTSGGTLSQRGSELAQTLNSLDPFPIYASDGSVTRGSLSLAHGLIGEPVFMFPDMYRRRTAAPRLRLSREPHPDGCDAKSDACPARILKRFTRGPGATCPVDLCTVEAKNAFQVAEQKMVDTLLACDLLVSAQTSRAEEIYLVSGDSDLVPPLLYASRQTGTKLFLVQQPKSGIGKVHEEFLSERGVGIVLDEGVSRGPR